MTVWKAGMLAVRVRDSSRLMAIGTICRVSKVCRDDYGAVVLFFFDAPEPRDGHYGWLASAFRPAVQDDQRCEDEFITLLNRSKPAKTPAAANPHQAPGVVPARAQSLLSTGRVTAGHSHVFPAVGSQTSDNTRGGNPDGGSGVIVPHEGAE